MDRSGRRTGEACLALPKLNLQFLTFHDYLLRNFNLFRLEATYEVRRPHRPLPALLRHRLLCDAAVALYSALLPPTHRGGYSSVPELRQLCRLHRLTT